MRKAIAINFIAKYSNVLIQILITAILARLVTPAEYGVIAVISVFISFFSMLGDVGVAPAIVQYRNLDEKNYSDIFKFMAAVSVVLSGLFFALSYGIAIFFGNTIYINVGHLLSLAILFSLLSIVPNGILLKNKKFELIGVASVLSSLISGVVAVLFAFHSFGVYALIINSVLQSLLNFLMLYRFSHFKLMIRNKFTFDSINQIKKFSIYQFLFNFVNYFTRNLDNLVIGKFLGVLPLGYYDKSYKLMLYPIQSFTFVITPVLQPFLSDYQNNKDRIFKVYMNVVKILSLIGVFITAVCFFSAKEIIEVLFGPQWLGSVQSFRILSLSIVLQMILSTTGSIFQATNNTKYMFQCGLFSFTCFTVLAFSGVLIGRTIEWVSLLLVFGFALNFIQGYYVLIRKVFQMRYWDFFRHLVHPLIIELVLFIAFFVFKINFQSNLLSLIVKAAYGLLVYLIMLYFTGEIELFRNMFRLKRSKKQA